MQWIDADTINKLLDYPSLCAAFAQAHLHPLPENADLVLQQPGSLDRFMVRPAWQQQNLVGVKLVSIFPDNHSMSPPLPSIQGLYVAFNGKTGAPEFVADGATLTARKTAADSALGLDLLAATDVRSMLMVGAGEMAGPLIQAFSAIRPSLRHVYVWNRTRPRAELLAQSIHIEGVELTVVNDLAEIIPKVHVICTATMSEAPLIHGALVAPGTHVNLVGGWQPAMREADDALMSRAEIYVDFRETALACGDLHMPLQSGAISLEDIRGDLFDLCRHQPLPPRADQITVFKNAGGAHLDLYAAQLLAQRIRPR